MALISETLIPSSHHACGGCNLQPGDLLGSGTLSGPGEGQSGSLLELTFGGKQPITLPNGEIRTFLLDGDTLILRGYSEREGARRIGFGECSGTIVPAPAALVSFDIPLAPLRHMPG